MSILEKELNQRKVLRFGKTQYEIIFMFYIRKDYKKLNKYTTKLSNILHENFNVISGTEIKEQPTKQKPFVPSENDILYIGVIKNTPFEEKEFKNLQKIHNLLLTDMA